MYGGGYRYACMCIIYFHCGGEDFAEVKYLGVFFVLGLFFIGGGRGGGLCHVSCFRID